jgi:uncharacterized protein
VKTVVAISVQKKRHSGPAPLSGSKLHRETLDPRAGAAERYRNRPFDGKISALRDPNKLGGLFMKMFFATVVLLGCGAFPVAAQTEDATKEDVQQFLSLMNQRQQMSVMVSGFFEQLTKTMVEECKSSHPNATAAELANIEQAASSVSRVAIQNFPIDEMIDAVAPIYQRHLTHSDMQTVIAFYSSPTGQKFIREAPAMMNEGRQASSAIMQKHLPEFKAQIEEAVRKAAPPSAAPPK